MSAQATNTGVFVACALGLTQLLISSREAGERRRMEEGQRER